MSQELIDAVNSMLSNLGYNCMTPEEISLINSLCLDLTNNLPCDTLKVVTIVLSYRQITCASGKIVYLKEYNECHDCKINIDDILTKPKSKIYAIGGRTRNGWYWYY